MTDQNRPKERRLHPRVTLDQVVEVGTGTEGAAHLRDLSMSGLACLSAVPFEEMAILEIAMELPTPDGNIGFKAGGAVVRCEATEDGRFLVGVFFTHMDDSNRSVLQRFIAANATSGVA